MNQQSRIQKAYKLSGKIYNDVLTQSKWWSRLYVRFFWQGVSDTDIAEYLLGKIPDDFSGRLLDAPAGTAVFTAKKYARMSAADIYCLDYSPDMLEQAKELFRKYNISGIKLYQGDIGKLPFEQEYFDIILSMNGFPAFADKEKAYEECLRVLKPGGKFLGCFYVRGICRRTDFAVKHILVKKGWFTPPFETLDSLYRRLSCGYRNICLENRGPMALFSCIKK